MPLEPTEREEHFFKAMVDAAEGNTPEELEPTERKEHWYQEIIDAIKTGGGSTGGGVIAVSILNGGGQTYLDKTYSEISNATLAVVKRTNHGETLVNFIPSYEEYDGEYYVYLSGNEPYKSDSADGRLYYDGGSN